MILRVSVEAQLPFLLTDDGFKIDVINLAGVDNITNFLLEILFVLKYMKCNIFGKFNIFVHF